MPPRQRAKRVSVQTAELKTEGDLEWGRAEVTLHDEFEVAGYQVPSTPVWTVRATHAFDSWAMGETRELIPDDRTRNLVSAGFLELVSDGTGNEGPA